MLQKKKNVDTKSAISIISLICIILINIVLWTLALENNMKIEQVSYATFEEETSNMSYLDLNNIISENTQNLITEELNVEEEEIEYNTIYKNNDELPKGTIQVLQEGRTGTQNIITKKTYKNGELEEEQTDTKIITAPIDRIVQIGTAKYTSNYKIKVGDYLYVTSETLAVRMEPDNNSNKIITINKNSKVKLLEIVDEWYYINYENYKGYVKSDCLTYKNPNEDYSTEQEEYTKQQLIANLSKSINLNKPSGLSISQFKKILSNNSSDKNNIISDNAEYFYYAEKQYNINGIFLAAVAIHESSWGTSKIALNKKNLFGYGANDSNPYENAKEFDTYSEGIDLVARVFVKYYLNAKGTTIYNGETAVGTYYNGNTLSDVNKRYASDKNWSNSVYKWMSYLYNKL